MAAKRPSRQKTPNEFATPPAAPVPWRIAKLRGKRVNVAPVVAQSWFEARAIAMREHGVEASEVELQR